MNFILLYACEHDDSNGTKYYVYEAFSTTFYALTPNESEDEVELQKILWSPASYESSSLANNNNNNNKSQKKVLPSSKSKVKTIEKSKISQAIAFIHDYDIYYKPKIHSDLVIRVTTSGEFICFVILFLLTWGKWKKLFLDVNCCYSCKLSRDKSELEAFGEWKELFSWCQLLLQLQIVSRQKRLLFQFSLKSNNKTKEFHQNLWLWFGYFEAQSPKASKIHL